MHCIYIVTVREQLFVYMVQMVLVMHCKYEGFKEGYFYELTSQSVAISVILWLQYWGVIESFGLIPLAIYNQAPTPLV